MSSSMNSRPFFSQSERTRARPASVPRPRARRRGGAPLLPMWIHGPTRAFVRRQRLPIRVKNAGMHPAVRAAIERQRIRHLARRTLPLARRRNARRTSRVSDARRSTRAFPARAPQAAASRRTRHVQRRRRAGRNRRGQGRALARAHGGPAHGGGDSTLGVARGDLADHRELLTVQDGLDELHVRRPPLKPGRTERVDERLGEVRVDGDAGHESAGEAVTARGGVVVDLVLAVGGGVDGLDGVLRERLRHGAECTAHPSAR